MATSLMVNEKGSSIPENDAGEIVSAGVFVSFCWWAFGGGTDFLSEGTLEQAVVKIKGAKNKRGMYLAINIFFSLFYNPVLP
jgi:hypothetical protein